MDSIHGSYTRVQSMRSIVPWELSQLDNVTLAESSVSLAFHVVRKRVVLGTESMDSMESEWHVGSMGSMGSM